MITNRQINEKYLRYKKQRITNGVNLDSLSPIAHALLLDASQCFFDKYLNKESKEEEVNMLVGAWRKGYEDFFKNFFLAFNKDEKDYIIEKMDEMESALEHSTFLSKIAAMEMDNSQSKEWQEEFAAQYLSFRFAMDAQDYHKLVYKTSRQRFCAGLSD